MPVTILGHNIRLIRPEKIKIPTIRKSDLPQAKYNEKPSELIKVNVDWVKESITIPPNPKYYSK